MTNGNGRGDGGAGAGLLLGVTLAGGLYFLGWWLHDTALAYRALERTVVVKGLAEREVPADVVIWPIAFTEAGNDLGELYEAIGAAKGRIRAWLADQGVRPDEMSDSLPAITDKLAQQYGGPRAEFRYSAQQSVTVYSTRVDAVRAIMPELSELGRTGIAFTGQAYANATRYLFTGLNELKPSMIEDATAEARRAAQEFAEDSDSRLGKIRRASQGQFSISDRDDNNPHLKKVRVVSTVEYYLVD